MGNSSHEMQSDSEIWTIYSLWIGQRRGNLIAGQTEHVTAHLFASTLITRTQHGYQWYLGHSSPNPKDEHQLTPPPPNPGEVVPDLHTSPGVFLDYLKALGLEELTTAWQHLQKPLVRIASTQLYDEAIIGAWTDRMDSMVVSINYSTFIPMQLTWFPGEGTLKPRQAGASSTHYDLRRYHAGLQRWRRIHRHHARHSKGCDRGGGQEEGGGAGGKVSPGAAAD